MRDRSQGAIAGAQLTITNVDTNLKYQATTGADGSYRILALPVGNYKLTVTATGFRNFAENDIVVKVNDQLEIDVTLEVGSAQQEVINVEANAVQVQTESTQLGDVIESKKMLALPLNGRSYIDLLGLQAGRGAQLRPVPSVATGRSQAILSRRQHLRQRPTRNGQRVPGEWRRCQRGTESRRRVNPEPRLCRRIPADHQQL